jgi:diguanylate cyclase (GGDEF)-like protein
MQRASNEMQPTVAAIAGKRETMSIRPSEKVIVAAKEMQRNNVGLLVVVDEAGRIVGVVSERDIVRASTRDGWDPCETRVSEIMTTEIATCAPETRISRAHTQMVSRHIRHLPIVSDDRPVGMISSRDVMTYQLSVTRAMKTAAEQTAQLIKRLKSLELREVLRIIGTEVPLILNAERWVLSFTEYHRRGHEVPIIHREHCPCQAFEAVCPQDMGAKPVIASVLEAGVPECCREKGCRGPRYFLGLDGGQAEPDREGRTRRQEGFLCMCGLPPQLGSADEVQEYKTWLLEDIVRATLSNAILYEEARRSSMIDPLTGLYKRGVLESKLAEEHERGVRYDRTYSLGLMDVDNFKYVNDSYGHRAGDDVLRRLADILRDSTRSCDTVARFGGDEFAILLPETDVVGAMAVMERVRSHAAECLRTPNDEPVTISCGLAEWSGAPAEKGDEIFVRADKALYATKHAGRNGVSVAEQPASEQVG